MIVRTSGDILICEGCGYQLAGIDPAGACPECGRPVARSAPERRGGSPWQVTPRGRSWLATGALVIGHPVACWDRILPEQRSADRLAEINLLVAAVLSGLGLALLNSAYTGGVVRWMDWLIVAAPITAVAYVVLVACVTIESIGIQLFSRRHRWRISSVVASTIIGHASYGWLLGAALFDVIGLLSAPFWFPNPPAWILATIAAVSAAVGLLSFETLTYIGVRRLRFVNVPGPIEPI